MSEAKKLQNNRESEKKKQIAKDFGLVSKAKEKWVDWIVPNSLVPLCYRTDHGFMVGRVYVSAP